MGRAHALRTYFQSFYSLSWQKFLRLSCVFFANIFMSWRGGEGGQRVGGKSSVCMSEEDRERGRWRERDRGRATIGGSVSVLALMVLDEMK